MPANFTKEEKTALIEKFYTQGYILLKKFGYKKLKIIDIAASVGVGTGTFYNFFKSKDEFIIWLIKRRKDETAEQFLLLSKEYPNGIPMTVFEQFLFDTISHNNIYRCLTQEDYNILQEKYGLLDNRNEKIEENAKFMMSKLATTKSIDDFFLFSEAYTIIIIGTSDLNKLNPKIINKVVKQLIHSVCQFLY